MDYQAIIHALVDSIVEHPESILVRVLPNENSDKDVTILIVTEKDDTARLIGRKGVIANALREVVGIAGKSENKHVHLKFESFEDEKVGA